jgi:hypothetical protein
MQFNKDPATIVAPAALEPVVVQTPLKETAKMGAKAGEKAIAKASATEAGKNKRKRADGEPESPDDQHKIAQRKEAQKLVSELKARVARCSGPQRRHSHEAGVGMVQRRVGPEAAERVGSTS